MDNRGPSAEQQALYEVPEFETGEPVDVGMNQSKMKGLSIFKDENEHISQEIANDREVTREVKSGRLKKMKVMEVKGETQTSKHIRSTNNHRLLMHAS